VARPCAESGKDQLTASSVKGEKETKKEEKEKNPVAGAKRSAEAADDPAFALIGTRLSQKKIQSDTACRGKHKEKPESRERFTGWLEEEVREARRPKHVIHRKAR